MIEGKKYFETAQPSDQQVATMKQTRKNAEEFGNSIIERAGGQSATTTLAIRHLQYAVMMGNRAVLELD